MIETDARSSMDEPVPRPPALLIWGAGGHGRVVADLAQLCGWQIEGFIDADPRREAEISRMKGAPKLLLQLEFLANSAATSGSEPSSAVALGIGDNSTRIRRFRSLGARASGPLVHPSAAIGNGVLVGRGSVLFAGCIVNADATIGEAVILNSGCIVEHDCVVASGAHVAPGAVLAGSVQVGERSLVGAGATVNPGVRIGSDAVVGSGAVVIRDVPAGATAVGNPARIIRTRSG